MPNKCRHCQEELFSEIIDLGNQPPSNRYLSCTKLNEREISYPLKVYLCNNCGLVQIPEILKPKELFTSDYAYFSSTSSSWCRHAKNFVENAIKKLNLNKTSYVTEIASNDGYLLQNFLEKEIPCIGIEPTKDTANESIRKGINTLEKFFTSKLALSLIKSDLVIANNVAAHVPDINDFLVGIKNILKPNGVATIEFPHVLNLVRNNQFDTIYHEHYSYFSLKTFKRIAEFCGLDVFDLEELRTHGGSLRVWLSLPKKFSISQKVFDVIDLENDLQITSLKGYEVFKKNVEKIKYDLIRFLIKSKEDNKKVIGYGAAAKGNTLLNYCGIKSDLLEYIVDKAKSKQNLFMPGSHIPIKSTNFLESQEVDFLLVLPWNLINEISNEQKNKKLVTAIPEMRFYKT